MRILRSIVPLAVAFTLIAAAAPDDVALKKAVASHDRTPTASARDQYNHPYDALKFWGLKPHQNIVEVVPGNGYWTEILAPYAKATGGAYSGTVPDLTGASEQVAKNDAAFRGRFSDESKYGNIRWQTWSGKGQSSLGNPGSADLVINSRYVHIWLWTPGEFDAVLKDIYTVLKPDGILAIEEHRSDPRAQVPDAHDAYVSTAVLIEAAQKAGFKLDGTSEISANPKDTKDYPFGQWTLPPNSVKKAPSFMISWPGRPADDTLLAPEAYLAIGESDRMILRFRKSK